MVQIGDRVILCNCHFSSDEMKARAAHNGFYEYVPSGIVINIDKDDDIHVLLDVSAHISIEKEEYVMNINSRTVTELERENIKVICSADEVLKKQERIRLYPARSVNCPIAQARLNEAAVSSYKNACKYFREEIGERNLEDYRQARQEHMNKFNEMVWKANHE